MSNFVVCVYILGDSPHTYICISVPPSTMVSDLQIAIKEKWAHRLQNCDAGWLKLWKVSIPTTALGHVFNSKLDEYSLDKEQILKPDLELSEIFPEAPPRRHIHIVVKVAKPSDVEYETGSMVNLLDKRKRLYDVGVRSPSETGKLHEFELMQAGEHYFACSRPEEKEHKVPLALLHPVFGIFVDQCKSVKLVPSDMSAVRALKTAMSQFYSKEDHRRDAFNQCLQDYGIHIISQRLGPYTADGHMEILGRPTWIDEVKLEVAASGAVPLFQVFMYYHAFLHASGVWMEVDSCHPCFITFVAGSQICFGGCVLTDRPTLEIFSILPLDFHSTDGEAFDAVGRHLSALKSGVATLTDYYTTVGRPVQILSRSPVNRIYRIYPYPTFFTLNDVRTEFSYDEDWDDNRLLFYGKLIADSKQQICIKFVRRYGRVVHDWFASRGLAPKLLGVEVLPGGWIMVVMERLDDTWAPLSLRGAFENHDELKKKIRLSILALGKDNLVHGDIRDTNVMVDNNGNFMLVDFDWAGRSGEVQYPRFLNTDPVLKRPPGAVAFESIVHAHDLYMVQQL